MKSRQGMESCQGDHSSSHKNSMGVADAIMGCSMEDSIPHYPSLITNYPDVGRDIAGKWHRVAGLVMASSSSAMEAWYRRIHHAHGD